MPRHPLCEADPRYAPYLISNGGSWRLYLNARDQCYLGRSYAWLTSRHVDNMCLHDLTVSERNELFNLSHRFSKALHVLGWNPSLLNACWLGNEVKLHQGHGHLHLIPRYERPPVFLGREFPDPRWGSNYAPNNRLVLPDTDLSEICDAIRRALPKYN